jgi:type IV pilus assembly protein PilY1
MVRLTTNLVLSAIVGLGLSGSPGRAEDIDIYAAPPGPSNAPNILIILDNSANWSSAAQRWPGGIKQGESQLEALRNLVGELDASVNVGLMMLVEGTGAEPSGAYVRFHLRPMDQANRNALSELIGAASGCIDGPNTLNGTPNCIRKNFDSAQEKVSAGKADYSAALFEAFKYYGGHTSPAHAADGAAGTPADSSHFGPDRYSADPGRKADPAAYTSLRARYVSPLRDTAACARNYVVLIGNGFPTQDAPASLLSGVEGATTQLALPNATAGASGVRPGTLSLPTGGNVRHADEWAKFLHSTDVSPLPGQQNVRTYTVDVFREQQDADQTALLTSMARAGGGRYFSARDEGGLTSSLRKVFDEIQSANSVFVSAALPARANVQGVYLNQVFVGMFRPDAQRKPRWAGNLKQYQLRTDGDDLNLADRNGDVATDNTTGFFAACSNSYWSSDSGQYWDYPGSEAIGRCATETSKYPTMGSTPTFSDAPDGGVVEKGGAAQRLRGVGDVGGTLVGSSRRYQSCATGQSPISTACRNVKTLDATNALVDFTTANTQLDSTLVDWVRGRDVDNENGNADEQGNPQTEEVRPSVHGAVIHSQPAAVDHGGDRGVIVYYGADDGMLHAIEGDKADNKGNEVWAFVAPEFFARLPRLRDNGLTTPLVRFANTVDGEPKDYFFDGPIAVHQSAEQNRVWIFASMRRGGRAIYAFDVSSPASPRLKWRRGCFTNSTTDDSRCVSGWSAIGQTWSKPQVVQVDGYPNPVLVFGGGYDTCEDVDRATRCSATPRKGAGVWFVDADNGRILRIYPTHYSVTGEIAVVRNAAGNLAYAYAGDTGSNLYRINVGAIVGNAFSSAWTSNAAPAAAQIAVLAGPGQPRKFLSGPEVFTLLGKHYVALGSGNREIPAYSPKGGATGDTGCKVSDEFYIVKDDPAVAQSGSGTTDLTAGDLDDISDGATSALDDAAVRGWRLRLDYCEKTVNKALAIGGKVHFGTHQPTDPAQVAACVNNLGRARARSINITSPANTSAGDLLGSRELAGGGIPPAPTAGVVQLDDGSKATVCVGCATISVECTSCSALESSKVPIAPPPTRSRVFWYLHVD